MGLVHDPARGHAACSGCGCCVLVCPVWWQERDLMVTPQGRAMARQGGAPIMELAESIDACRLCGACAPVCPENMDTLGMLLTMRQELNELRKDSPDFYPAKEDAPPAAASLNKSTLLLAEHLAELYPRAFVETIKMLGGPAKVARAPMDLRPLSKRWQSGQELPTQDLKNVLNSLAGADTLIVEEGQMIRPLRHWLPGVRVMGVGEALLKANVSMMIREDDFLVIESSAYNMEQPRLVPLYDKLNREVGCGLSLDLQRMAMSAGANSLQGSDEDELSKRQAAWILKGRKAKRILTEDARDVALYQQVTDLPVMHIGFAGEGIDK